MAEPFRSKRDPSRKTAHAGHSSAGGAPGATGKMQAVFNECVHCGFCLPACPTYDVLGNEMDSPRGRLYLMRALETGQVGPSEPVVRHLDLCLGCRACETDCPSGVRFGERLEAARSRLRRAPTRPRSQRLAEALVLAAVGAPPAMQWVGATLLSGLHRAGLPRVIARSGGAVGEAAAAGVTGGPAAAGGEVGPDSPDVSGTHGETGKTAQAPQSAWVPAWRLPARVATAARLLSESPPRPCRLPRLTPARGRRAMRVGILEGCVTRWLFGPVNAAAVRLLSASGCEVVSPAGQRCCGALHAHAGDLKGARRLARANIAAFERQANLGAIAVTAAGCGSVMKNYGELLGQDAAWRSRSRSFSERVRDALEILAGLDPPRFTGEVRASVAYHDACHLAHAQGIRNEPRHLLEAVPGLELVPLAEADRCCGSAGIYNLLHPEVASEILRVKIDRLKATGASIAAAANPGCLMQIAAGARLAGLRLRVAHPLEILDEACRGGAESGRAGNA